MRIGIDIDGVLTNDDDFVLEYATKFCYENNIDFYKNPYLWETRKFNWTEDVLQKYRDKYFWEYAENEPPRKFASEVINKLKQEGNEIYIITSRYPTALDNEDGQRMKSIILKWLEKYNIPYDGIYFSEDKTVEIQDLKLDLFIEDSPKTIPIYEKYVHILCFDCRYNTELKCENMTRVFSWYDIYVQINKSNKMRIGIDIDNVISSFDNELLKEYLKHDKTLRNTGIISENADYIRRGMFDWTEEEEKRFYKENIERIANNLKPIHNAKKYIDRLKEDGNEIYIITGRDNGDYANPYDMTINWLKKHEISYDRLILTNAYDKQAKADECVKNNIDIMIEDSTSTAMNISKCGIKVLLMNTRFNQKCQELERVSSWREIYSKIAAMYPAKYANY